MVNEVKMTSKVKYSRLIFLIRNSSIKPVITASRPPILIRNCLINCLINCLVLFHMMTSFHSPPNPVRVWWAWRRTKRTKTWHTEGWKWLPGRLETQARSLLWPPCPPSCPFVRQCSPSRWKWRTRNRRTYTNWRPPWSERLYESRSISLNAI